MKKTYITPEVETLEMESINLMAGSPEDPGYAGGGDGTADSRFLEDVFAPENDLPIPAPISGLW